MEDLENIPSEVLVYRGLYEMDLVQTTNVL